MPVNDAVLISKHERAIGIMVAFAQFQARNFDFFKSLEPYPYHKIYICDPHDYWYNRGVPGLGVSIEETAESISRIAKGLGDLPLMTLGTSMGGYAALLFGTLIPAERVIAFGPQIFLNPFSPHARNPRDDKELSHRNIAPLVIGRQTMETFICIGGDDLHDVYHCLPFNGHSHISLYAVKNSEHEVGLFLKRKRVFGEFLQRLVNNAEGIPAWSDPVFSDAGRCDIVKRACDLYESSKFREAADALSTYLADDSEWSAGLAFLWLLRIQTREHRLAVDTLQKAVEANPDAGRAWQNLGMAYWNLEEMEKAKEALLKAKNLRKLPPKIMNRLESLMAKDG